MKVCEFLKSSRVFKTDFNRNYGVHRIVSHAGIIVHLVRVLAIPGDAIPAPAISVPD